MQQRQLLEHAMVRRPRGLRLLDDRQVELVEKNRFELPRRRHIELVPRQLGAPRVKRLELGLRLFRQAFEELGVDPDPVELHRRKHPGQRKLDLVEQPLELPLVHPWSQQLAQPKGEIGPLIGVARHRLHLDLIPVQSLLALPSHRRFLAQLAVQLLSRDIFETMCMTCWVEQITRDRRVELARREASRRGAPRTRFRALRA